MSQTRGLRPLDPIFSPGKRLGAIAVGNTPGDTGAPEEPRFSWPGLMDSLDVSPAWVMGTGGSYTEIAVAFGTVAAVEFDVLVNGVSAGTVTTAATGALQTFVSTITVVRDDRVQLDLTDFGTGLAEDVSVTLRNPV